MPSKLQTYSQMADEAARQITDSHTDWTAFLRTAGRLYKYPYNEQLMIHAQRPDATACAEFDFWNNAMHRYVRRGSRGIALIDATGELPKIRYVFDVSDTGSRENSRSVNLWELKPEYFDTVSAMLERNYDISGAVGLADRIERVAAQLADEYWNNHRIDVYDTVDNSFLEEYDDFNIGVQFCNAATVSITYALMSRCGLEPEDYLEHEDFLSVFDFNTPSTVAALGTAVSEISQQVLRQIEITVKNYERTHENERINLHEERRLPDTRPDVIGAADEAVGEIRATEESISEGTPPDTLESPDTVGEAVPTPIGDRGNGESTLKTDDSGAHEIGGDNGSVESDRPDEVGGADEQLQGTGGGNDISGADLQLSVFDAPMIGEQMSLFPSEDEQISYIEQADERRTYASVSASPFAFWFAQEEIDHILRLGSNTDNSRMRITAEFMKQKPLDEITEFLKKEYHGGFGMKAESGDISAWYTEDGILLAHGRTAQYTNSAQTILWREAADRISQLLENGQFAANVELAETGSFERGQLAQSLWFMRQDFSDEAIERGFMPTITDLYKGGFPDSTANIAAQLADPEFRKTVMNELQQFAEAYAADRELMRFHLYRPAKVYELLHEINLPRREYATDMAELPELPTFITEDEINEALSNGSSVEGGKGRIYEYFTENHTPKEKQDFLKNEYGISGRSHAVSGTSGSYEDHSGKGITLKKNSCADVQLPWNQVVKRIDELVRKGRYLTPEEKRQRESANITAREITQEYIDSALTIWNGNSDSKHRVIEYMSEHARERNTAAWLQNEFGGDLTVFTVTNGDTTIELPWARVQRSIGQLVENGEFIVEQKHPTVDDMPAQAEATAAESEVEPIQELEKFQYSVGETVYLEDGKPFIITEIRDFSVQLQDPTLFYPIFRAESMESFERLMQRYPQTERTAPEMNAETVAVYPGEKNNLPYDIVIERMHMDEPERTPPTVQPTAENFRITDDNLGTGGTKAKFRANMDAIKTLQTIELEARSATTEEQEILSKYVGWGGLPQAFDADNKSWENEYLELKAALSPDEYTAARASTLNAHYTSPTVIKAIYETVGSMGFETGNILEPSMGVGNFFGLLPEAMQNSRLYGVELDSITGRIAKQLYPKADITVAGFETTDRRDFFDLAVGNVPFGSYKVNDRAYNKLGFSIHDYFFAKTLDQVRPGGVIAFVTSRYTMDKQSFEVRKYIAQHAELLGAIRLPNNAFKANAGTEVTSDIIFLQKRDRPIDIDTDWLYLGQTTDGITVNSYFAEHPEMILGTLKLDDMMYGDKKEVTCEPFPDATLADLLHEAVQHIGGEYKEAELPDLGDGESIDTSIPADPNVKNFSYTIVDGEVYFRENSRMVKPELSSTVAERVKGMVEQRDCVHKLIGQQMDGFISDSTIRETQAELNRLYDDFTAKHGLIGSRGNALAFADDSSYYLLCSLEILDENGELARKADMFTKRTIKPHEVVTSVDTASEALALSISEKACVDMDYMSKLTGKDEETLAGELSGVVFRNPQNQRYEAADEYLSGNVREKLRIAKTAAENDSKFTSNVTALEAAQPKDLDASEIEVRLGATWIGKEYIQQFMFELLNPASYLRRSIEVNYSEFTAEWNITGKNQVSYSDVNAYVTYGTDRANAYRILEDTLNLRDIRIYDTVTDPDGKERRVLNSKETTLAQQKQQAIKDAFRDWIWKAPDRRQTLAAKYNEIFNSCRPREYDGRHIVFSGINPEIRLREHQLNAVAHILYGGNTLLAHEVGAGKTFEMAAAAMESRRLGLCQKSLFAVPNHLTEQWASEFLRLYPSANILVATKKDFETRNRKKFCARIATGEYDAVIIGHSQFERIPVSIERQQRLLSEQIDEISEGIDELKASRAERFTIKQLERTKKSLETRLEKLLTNDRKDDVIAFEQLGVDRLYVDEAHNFKNLFLYTKMRNVAGLSTTDAQKSSDMFLKCRYIDEITENKGVIFATGTPVSNSMTELYTMMRYLQHDTIKRQGLAHFDCWASIFGETSTAIELAPEGTGYRARTRFAKFFNLPELMNGVV